MWFFGLQLALLGLTLFEIKEACVAWHDREVYYNQITTNMQLSFPWIPIVAGHYLLYHLFRQDVDKVFVLSYYGLFYWFLPSHGWPLCVYYIPAFIGHFLALELIPIPAAYTAALGLVFATYVPYWWVLFFLFGMHGILIACFMFLMGAPTRRQPGTYGFFIHARLNEYFCFSSKIWTVVSKYIL